MSRRNAVSHVPSPPPSTESRPGGFDTAANDVDELPRQSWHGNVSGGDIMYDQDEEMHQQDNQDSHDKGKGIATTTLDYKPPRADSAKKYHDTEASARAHILMTRRTPSEGSAKISKSSSSGPAASPFSLKDLVRSLAARTRSNDPETQERACRELNDLVARGEVIRLEPDSTPISTGRGDSSYSSHIRGLRGGPRTAGNRHDRHDVLDYDYEDDTAVFSGDED